MIQFVAGAAGAGLIVGSLGAWYLTAEYKDTQWGLAISNQKVEAAAMLRDETDRVMAIHDAAAAKVRELEAQHVRTEKNLDVIQRRNRFLATELGGLRDPGRRASSQDAVPGTAAHPDSVADTADAGLLSAQTTAVLLDASAEADTLANYARTCYDYVQSLKPSEVP